jgi:hypothetical protein
MEDFGGGNRACFSPLSEKQDEEIFISRLEANAILGVHKMNHSKTATRSISLIVVILTISLFAQVYIQKRVEASSANGNDIEGTVVTKSEEAKLIPGIQSAIDDFGQAIAQSSDMAVIGAPFTSGNKGAAYVYKRNGDNWEFLQILVANDGAAQDRFGISAAISGNLLAIGADRNNPGAGVGAGAVYLFQRNGDAWTQVQKLSASDAQTNASFGTSVAVFGSQVVVGAPGQDVNNLTSAGQAYFYENEGSGWTEHQKLLPDTPTLGAGFGKVVGVSLRSIVVGLDSLISKTYVFRRPNFPTWEQTQEISFRAESLGIENDRLVLGSTNPFVPGNAIVYGFDGTNWNQEQALSPAGRTNGYGRSVSLSGNTVVVGDINEVVGDTTGDAVYVFTLSSGTWSEQKHFAPGSDTEYAEKISVFGEHLLVGDPSKGFDQNNEPANVYAYSRTDGVWSDATELSRFQQDSGFLGLGSGMDIEGDIAVVGAIGYHSGPGQAYVFKRNGTEWSLLQVINPTGPEVEFGMGIALQGDTLVIGGEDTGFGGGVVEVYQRNGDTFSFQQLITGPIGGSDFGGTVELDGDNMVIGARNQFAIGQSGIIQRAGAAYVYVRNAGVWEEQQALVSDAPIQGEHFGYDVDIEGNTVVVGAPERPKLVKVNNVDTLLMNRGAVYVFTRNGTAWTLQTRLDPPEPETSGLMGIGLALEGNTLAVGMPNHKISINAPSTGAIFVYTGAGAVWTEQQRIFAPDGVQGDNLGFSVEMTSNAIVASAPFQDNNDVVNTGSAYVFSLEGGTWVFNTKLLPSDAVIEDELGQFTNSTAIDGNTVLLGSAIATRNGIDSSGAAYAFRFGNAAPPNTPPGNDVTVQALSNDASISFSQVTGEGETTFVPIDPNNEGGPPSGFSFCPTCAAYEIATTATYVSPIKVCLDVPATIDTATFNTMILLHGDNGVFTDVTTERNTRADGTREICGMVSSLSPFALGQPVPNSPPVLSNISVSTPISENGVATLSGNIADSNAGNAFSLTVNWGDGSTAQVFTYPAGTSSFSETHTFADDPVGAGSGSFTIGLSLDDGAGGIDTDSTSVTVNNQAPQLSDVAPVPSTITVGQSTTLSGSISDASANDSFTVVINWGDGTTNTTLNRSAGSTSFSANHQYSTVGSKSVSVTLTDDDGGSTTGGTTVTVEPVPSAPAAPSGLTVRASSSSQIDLRWTDNSNNEASFEIERCSGKGKCTTFVFLTSVGANIVLYQNTGLTKATDYSYRVRAVNAIGSSAYSNVAKTKTLRK